MAWVIFPKYGSSADYILGWPDRATEIYVAGKYSDSSVGGH